MQNRIRKLEAGERISENLTDITRKLRETLQAEAIRDPLTGLYSQGYLNAFLEQEACRVEYRNAPVGVIMLDVDQFKMVNETYGHEAGDTVLKELGTLLRSYTRGEDIACRYDEKEFLLILPGASLEVARQRAEGLERRVKQLQIPYQDKNLNVTISLGVAALPNHGPDAGDAVNMASEALCQARARGHGQLVVASS